MSFHKEEAEKIELVARPGEDILEFFYREKDNFETDDFLFLTF